MTSFQDVVNAVPDLAERVRTILSSTQNSVLGTLRHDGSPRLSGIDCYIGDGRLCIASAPGTLKGRDLRRDPRMSLHSIPWDSRQLRPEADDPGAADAKVSGRARRLTDAVTMEAIHRSLAGEGAAEPPEAFELFEVDIDSVAVMFPEDSRLVVDQWSSTGGRNRPVAGG
ncbi:MAG: pyridoxamine 5'-phosphate oxidase family protein [Streptosporangiaceae bacterium]